MKQMKRYVWIVSMILLIAMLACTLAACDTDSRTMIPFVDTEGTSESTLYVKGVRVEDGSILVTYSDGSCVNIGSSVTNVNETTIENVTLVQDEENTTMAASRALRSTVQVVCGFKKNVLVSTSFWGGGYRVEERSYTASGSGVIYQLDKASGKAYIITNQHVVYDSDSITDDHVSDDISIYLHGSTEPIEAAYVGGSADYDIAVLQVDGSVQLKSSAAAAAAPTDTSALVVGSTALVVGNPEGAGISATSGIISVDSETIIMSAIDGSGAMQEFRVIRVDAAVNSGNSGGGLYNAKGELIGIVNAKIVSSSIENIGYAIPANVAIAVAQNIIDGEGTFRRCVLRVTPTGVETKLVYDQETLRTAIEETVRISEVTTGGAGDEIGLQKGDVIRSIRVGERGVVKVTRTFHIIDEMLNARVGDVIEITVERQGTETTLRATVEASWVEQ